jgi:multisubunit Na+/H+ antiporter MnhB subunit
MPESRMRTKPIYLVLCFVGAVLPYWQFVTWLFQHGFDGTLFLRQLLANRISAFFALDVVVSAIVLIIFVRVESTRLRIRRRWLPIKATLLVGVSLGLPLFLYMRELQLEHGS